MTSYAKRTCKCCGIKLPADSMLSVRYNNTYGWVCSKKCKQEFLSTKEGTPKSFLSDITVGKMVAFTILWPITVPVFIITLIYKIIIAMIKK